MVGVLGMSMRMHFAFSVTHVLRSGFVSEKTSWQGLVPAEVDCVSEPGICGPALLTLPMI